MSHFALALVVCGLTTASVAWRAFAMSVLWGWFIVPRFGAPALDMASAIGLSLVASLLTHQFRPSSDRHGEILADIVLTPAFCLTLGWIVRSAA